MEYLCLFAFLWGIFGILGSWIASQKGRSSGEGFVLGFLFGPIGALIEAVLPTITIQQPQPSPQPRTSPNPPTPEEKAALHAAMQAARGARLAQHQALDEKIAREVEEAQRRVRESQVRMRESLIWFLGTPGRCYLALPDWAQPIVWGLAIAIPVVTVSILLIKIM